MLSLEEIEGYWLGLSLEQFNERPEINSSHITTLKTLERFLLFLKIKCVYCNSIIKRNALRIRMMNQNEHLPHYESICDNLDLPKLQINLWCYEFDHFGGTFWSVVHHNLDIRYVEQIIEEEVSS